MVLLVAFREPARLAPPEVELDSASSTPTAGEPILSLQPAAREAGEREVDKLAPARTLAPALPP